jgi:integrase
MGAYKDNRTGDWYVDIYYNHKRYRKKSPENSKKGAKAFESLLRQKIITGQSMNLPESQQTNYPTFKDFSREWFETYVKTNNKFSEIRGKRFILNTHLIGFFGQYRLDEITAHHIEKYKTKKINTGLSNKTVNNHLTVLSKCLNTAREWEILEKTPFIKKLKVAPQKFDFLSKQECEILLQNTDGILREMILICWKTGVRFGELKGIRWEDVDWGIRAINIRRSIYRNRIVETKSYRERQIPLTDDVYEILNSRKKSKGFVFENKNKTLKDTTTGYWLHQACKRANLRRIGWHTLRHTFASHLAMNGATMQAVKELMGHSDLMTTQRYAHLAPSTLVNTVKLLNPRNYCQYIASKSEIKVEFPLVTVPEIAKILPKTKQKKSP